MAGIYRIACETGAKIVPIVHYLRDNDISKNNSIHTVIDDPIRIDNLTERQALNCIRNVFATWYYLIIEAYGKSTRREIIGAASTTTEAWERQLAERTGLVAHYDREIELWADYRPKWKISPQQVWQAIADVTEVTPQNVQDILYARDLVVR